MLHYPPVCVMMTLLIGGTSEEAVDSAMKIAFEAVQTAPEIQTVGPVNAPIYKLNDIYRKILYMKSENYDILIKIRNQVESVLIHRGLNRQVGVQFDFL